ncbi:MAG: ATP-binding protein [Candidatus Diapherotrites archaeon]|nr:ATP-binding protein [Candidatus Diapherotrites archaeon]
MRNPFTPGNGIEPAYLAGRQEYIQEFIKSLKETEEGLPRNIVVYGLRGTGKTVLLRHYKILAETNNWLFMDREFNERYCNETEFAQVFGKDLIAMAAEVSIKKKIEETGKKLIESLKVEELSGYGITYKPYHGEKREVLEDYLKELLESNWPVFEKSNKKGVVLLYDEFHLVKDKKEDQQYVLSSLLSAIAQVQREGCRYVLCLSGLPALKTNLKEAKTYTERMFNYQEVGNLDELEAEKALTEPLKKTEYKFESKLVSQVIEETQGYPYFLQFYGYFLADNAKKANVLQSDLVQNKNKLLKMLDKSFFEDRFNLASAMEKKALLAMATCKEKEIPAKYISKKMKLNYMLMQKYLVRLIDKGLIYRAQRGYYAFSVPLLQDFLKRQ